MKKGGQEQDEKIKRVRDTSLWHFTTLSGRTVVENEPFVMTTAVLASFDVQPAKQGVRVPIA